MNREAYSTGKCFHQLFEAQAERRPAQTAVVCGDARLTYAELNARANQLARRLRARGAGPETLVAVSVSRSAEMAVAILAVLKAGAAYLPLDPAYPAERLKFMLGDAQVPLLVADSRIASRLPSHNAETVLLDADWPLISQLGAANVESGVTRDNLAYVIYTSGSTGEPKGVMLTHANLTHYVAALAAELGINSEDVYLHLASIAFSSSRRHLMLPLACGAGVVIASEDERRDPSALFELIKARGVTVMDAVPSFWRVSTQWLAGLDEGRRARLLDNKLRLMLSASEPLLSDIPRTWRRDFKHPARHVHMFGQTETSGIVALNRISDDFGDEVKVVPAGRPIADTQIYLLDSHLNPVADGEPGEIYVSGEGLARGYLNRPELTAEKFIEVRSAECGMRNLRRADSVSSSFRTPHSALRICKTGDWARWLPDGSFEVLGRQDFQVKIRGQRVELTEIEALLTGHAGVAACAVAAREDEAGDRRLVAYVVPRGGAKLAAAELRSLIKGKLPDYMLPAAFVELDALPLTPNGKLDRRALPAPGETRAAATDYVVPQGETQELLATQWAALLKLARVGADDNFFELGGHSLLATQAVARAREAFRVELPLGAIFESPTVAGLARRIDVLAHTSGAVSASIKPRAPLKQWPLSFAQQRLWFLDQLEPGNCSYHVRRAVRLTGRLDAEALSRALSSVVARHEILRTNFISADGEPAQVVREAANVEMPTDDLSRLDGTTCEDEIQRIINAEADRPFDLAADPLLRARLLRLGGEDHVLLLVLHHIVIDGWSMSLLLNELFTALAVETLDRQPSPLPALPIQYADYAVWQRERLQGEQLQREVDYWKRQLAGIPATLELPTDRPRPAVPSSVGGEVSRVLPRRLYEDLQALSRREGATLFMTLLSGFYALLQRHSGQQDVVVGSPIAGRTSVETEGLIGFFVNTLALRGDVSGDPPFLELLGRVREAALGAYAHQEVPFEKLVEELHPERSLNHTPLFQVMFALQNDALPRQGLAGLTFGEVRTAGATAKFDLTLDVFEEAEGLRATLEYSADLFDEATAERMLGHFEALLAGTVADPSRRVSELPLLTPAEQYQLLVEWNAHALNKAESVCVHRLIEAQAAAKPDAEAVVSLEQRLTYRELNERANRLARHLRRLGVGPETLVAVSVERSPEMIVAVLAVMKAGGAYLPLDPMYPQERLAFMLEDANVGVLLTERRLLAGLPPHAAETVCLDADWPTIARESGENLSHEVSPEDLAYVIYTSGSTGRSKGVMVEHGSLASAYRAWESAYELHALTAHLQMASFSFDVFTGDLVRALCSGAKLVLCPRELLLAPADLYALMRRKQVDAAEFVPAVMRQLAAHLDETGADLSFLRLVVVGSDAWYLSEYEKVRGLCGAHTRLINSYGITETTIDNTYFERRAGAPRNAGDGLVPIGRPLANTKIYILDAKLQPMPVGVAGELYIGGPCVTRGYLNRTELTAEKFIEWPQGDAATASVAPSPLRPLPPSRLYKTGDRARYLPDGNIEFLGRADDQVKIRGFRIELSEVEGALSRHPQVRECAAVVREDEPGDRRLVAYFVAADGADVTGGELRAFLKESLPDQMIPSAFVRLDALPLSPNGKVNRRALPAPDLTGRDQEGGYVAPQGVTEEAIAGIWQRVLGVERVGAEDNFFALGGHSLLATQVISRVADACGVRLPLRSIFETPTVAGLAAAVAELQAPAGDEELAAMLAELEGLSDEEAMELLAAEGA